MNKTRTQTKARLIRAALLLFAVLVMLGGTFAQNAAIRTDAEAYGGEMVKLPVLMYHSILQDPSRAGRYVLTPAQLEQDLAYLSDNGYTTVSAAELVYYTRGLADLPEKPVLITFDDGFYNNYVYALPLLERYDMRAIISVVGSLTDQYSHTDDRNPMYAYLGWDDICALRDSRRIEIGNHTYGLHTFNHGRNGVKRKPGEAAQKHSALLLEDIGGLQRRIEQHCDFTPIVFAYPFGARDADSEAVIRELGFLVILTSYERTNKITRDPRCLYELGRFNRPAGESTEAFMKRALG